MRHLKKSELFFLLFIVLAGIAFRLMPRLALDPHLLTFQADIWYRLCLAQYLIDHGSLPEWDIRYLAYGHVPLWYNPLALHFLAFLHNMTQLDLPTVCSRIMPVIESFSIIPTYFLCRYLYNRRAAVIATVFLTLSPSFLFWTGISTPQSFTVFLLPITILLWVRFLQGKSMLGRRWLHLLMMGALLALNFLTHLSFFTHIMILIAVQIGLLIEKKSCPRDFIYLLAAVMISQALTAFWWLPQNLYWWWTVALSPSSNLTKAVNFLTEYGPTSAIVGHLALLALVFLVLKHRKAIPDFYLVPLFWAIFPILESHNEFLLTLSPQNGLIWNNLFKPLDGYRFYLFLAQPLAIAFALVADRVIDLPAIKRTPLRRVNLILTAVLLAILLLHDTLFIYDLPARLMNSGFKTREIKAAVWFRQHSRPDDRILADYYTAQMFSGICGGKALLGSMLPLKNVPFPYITERNRVLNDIYSLYANGDAGFVKRILDRYGCSHLYVSDWNIGYVEYLMQNSKGPHAARPVIDKLKLRRALSDDDHFKIVYQDRDMLIVELIKDGPSL